MRVVSMLACVLAAVVAAGAGASGAAAGTMPQMIVVTGPAPATASYNSAFIVGAVSRTPDNGPTNLTVAISVSGICTLSGSLVTLTSGTGTCTVRFDQAGDATYAAAPEIVQTVTATKADQTITFRPLPPKKTYKVASDFPPLALP